MRGCSAQPNVGTLALDHWNEPVTLTAPKGALDFSHLGNG